MINDDDMIDVIKVVMLMGLISKAGLDHIGGMAVHRIDLPNRQRGWMKTIL